MFFHTVYKSGQIFLPFCHNPRVWRTDGQTDGQTDRQTEFSSLDRVCITCSAVKTTEQIFSEILPLLWWKKNLLIFGSHTATSGSGSGINFFNIARHSGLCHWREWSDFREKKLSQMYPFTRKSPVNFGGNTDAKSIRDPDSDSGSRPDSRWRRYAVFDCSCIFNVRV